MGKLIIDTVSVRARINRHIYGHFAEHLGRCIYGGFWVGEDSKIPNTRGIRNDIVQALRKINIPNLRWPGGCFADEYNWMDGIGPREKRPVLVNTHWGGVTENNHFGTHEFMDLCEQLDCEAYVAGNMGSGTVREMQQWVEYLNFGGVSPMANLRAANGRKEPWGVKFFGVGNESWTCGGNMRAEYYADEYRRYATYCRDYANKDFSYSRDTGEVMLFKIACGPKSRDYDWTEVLMDRISPRQMQGLALHYYTMPGSARALSLPYKEVPDLTEKRGSATEFSVTDWFATMKRALLMEELVKKHTAIMDKHDPEKKVALAVDEWGTWYDPEPGTNPGFLYQQNTLRDALTAGLTLNIFNNHCERVRLACIAQTINVLQAMILTDEEKMIVTPSYHVFEMYKVHHDATMLPVELECGPYQSGQKEIPSLSASASRHDDGTVHLSLCNLHPSDEKEVAVEFRGFHPRSIKGRILTSGQMNAHNTFEDPERVMPREFSEAKCQGQSILLKAPGKSVIVLEIA